VEEGEWVGGVGRKGAQGEGGAKVRGGKGEVEWEGGGERKRVVEEKEGGERGSK